MVYAMGRLSWAARRAWAIAYVTALNRGSADVTIEDALFGACKALGDPALGYFQQPSMVTLMMEEIARSAHVHDFDLAVPATPEDGASGETAEIAFSLPRLPLSRALQAVFANAELSTKTGSRAQVEVHDLLVAIASHPESRARLKARGVEFRGDAAMMERESPASATGDSLSLPEALELFQGWARASTRVTCDFSAAGSIATSLGLKFQITGAVRLIDADSALIRIDGEKASCLIELRGAAVSRTCPAGPRRDTPSQAGTLRIEILFATGGRCSVSPLA